MIHNNPWVCAVNRIRRHLCTRQGHPTEYFGKISVRMEGRLRISKFFPSDALDFSENHKVSLEFSELMCSLLSCPIIFGRFCLFSKIFVWLNYSKSC